MAIKKPITKTLPSKTTAPTQSKFKKKMKEEAVAEDEVEETEEEEPEEEEDLEPPKKLTKKQQIAAEEEEETPRRKGSSLKKAKREKKSLADVFDSTKPGRGLFPIGEFKAYVNGFTMDGEIAEDPDDQGKLVIIMECEGHEDNENEEVIGKTIKQRYGICGEDGEAGQGIPFLKGDLDLLGYEDVTLEDLEEIFEDVETTRPEVVIKTKANGQYVNMFLQGLAESE